MIEHMLVVTLLLSLVAILGVAVMRLIEWLEDRDNDPRV